MLAEGTARAKALGWEEAQDTRGSGRAVWLECRGEGEWPGMRLRRAGARPRPYSGNNLINRPLPTGAEVCNG